MKKYLIAITIALPLTFAAYAQQDAPTDTVTTALDEVVVTADPRIETAGKVILRPTKLEKKHSTNGYTLLAVSLLPSM